MKNFIIITLSIFICNFSYGQTESDTKAEVQATENAELFLHLEKEKTRERHSVKIGNKKLFEIKEKYGSFTAEQRAEVFTERLNKFIQNKNVSIESLHLKKEGEAIDIVAGNNILFSVTDVDARNEGVDQYRLAEERLEVIKESVKKERETRSIKSLTINAGIACLLTLLLLAVLYSLKRFFQFIYYKVEKSKGLFIKSIRVKNVEILNEERIASAILFIARVFRFFTTLVILYLYLSLVLGLFPWTEEWADKLYEYVVTPLDAIWKVFVGFIPNIFFIAIICVITYYVLGFVKLIFDEIGKGTLHFVGFHREWAEPTYKLVRILIFAFAFIVIFPYLPGAGSAAFQGVSVFLGILISLGSSSAIGNMVAGIVITYMRPFKIGDRVKIGDTMGDVIEKTLLVTRIKTIKNVDITIPNSMVLGCHIINYNSSKDEDNKELILNTTVTIGYDVEWRKVHQLLINAALNTANIVKSKKPFVFQTALNDFSVAYELNAFTDDPQRMAQTYSSLHQNIQDSFHSAGVEIMSPNFMALRDGSANAIPEKPHTLKNNEQVRDE